MGNSKIGGHISGQFNRDLEVIRDKVMTMGGLVEQQVELAIQSLTTNNMELAELVIKQDNQVDAMEIDIDYECMQIMALRQPAAFDLRWLVTVTKIINELEIIGDLAERIAKMALQLADLAGTRNDQYYEIQHISSLIKDMLSGALDAFARLTIEDISAITDKDENVDREYASIFRQLITHMMEDPRNITRTINVLWSVRAMERIGDHACYICEHVVFMIKGESVRHLTKEEFVKKIADQ